MRSSLLTRWGCGSTGGGTWGTRRQRSSGAGRRESVWRLCEGLQGNESLSATRRCRDMSAADVSPQKASGACVTCNAPLFISSRFTPVVSAFSSCDNPGWDRAKSPIIQCGRAKSGRAPRPTLRAEWSRTIFQWQRCIVVSGGGLGLQHRPCANKLAQTARPQLGELATERWGSPR